MEEYRFGGSKGSGAKSSKSFRLEVEALTTTTAATTTTTTSVTEDTGYHPDYLDYPESETTEENRDSDESLEYHDYHDHNEEHHYYDEDYPEAPDDEHHNHGEEHLSTAGEGDELEDQEHEIREHSEAMTEHEFLDHDGANETFIESSRLHVDEAEARDSQLIENVRWVCFGSIRSSMDAYVCLSFCYKVLFLHLSSSESYSSSHQSHTSSNCRRLNIFFLSRAPPSLLSASWWGSWWLCWPLLGCWLGSW